MDNFNGIIQVGDCSRRTWRILGLKVASFFELWDERPVSNGLPTMGVGRGSEKSILEKIMVTSAYSKHRAVNDFLEIRIYPVSSHSIILMLHSGRRSWMIFRI